MNGLIDLTIVIVNWNSNDLLRNCLDSIEREKGLLTIQTIVIDNNSADGSREMVHNLFPQVQLLNSGGNLGFARANNIAVAYAESQLILFLNPDTIVLEGALQKMIEHMQNNCDTGGLGCKMVNPNGQVQPLGLQWFPNPLTELINILFLTAHTIEKVKGILPYVNPEHNGYVKKLYGGCLLVRKSILDQVGWFDERFFMYGEDVDLCRRINESGSKLYYLKDAEIIHIGGGSSNKTISEFSVLMMCDSISKLIDKYNGFPGYCFYRIAIFLGSNIRLLLLLAIKKLPYLKRYADDYDRASKKYRVMIRWSLNLQQPSIPS